MEVLKRGRKIFTRFGAGPALSSIAGMGRINILHGRSSNVELCLQLLPKYGLFNCQPSLHFSTSPETSPSNNIESPDNEFQPLDLIRSKNTRFQRQRKKRERKEVPPPRYLKMPTDQDWPSVWPTAKTFHPASVPLPMHQGYVEPGKGKPVPGKFANLELMKIPNFLHLTPPAIKRHCEAIKKFCTPWPEELQDDYVLENLFPIEIITNDYCHSSPSIRDSKARIVTLRIKLSTLNLDDHAKDKFLRLIGERYNPKHDEITFVIDCCPLRKQNYDYAMYLLTACCHESWSKDSWEDDKSEEDMEKFVWEGSKSQEIVQRFLGPEEIKNKSDVIDKYKDAVSAVLNLGESHEAMIEYGKSVRQLLNLPVSATPKLETEK